MLTFRDGNPWPWRYAVPAIVALGIGGWALIFVIYELGLLVWEMV